MSTTLVVRATKPKTIPLPGKSDNPLVAALIEADENTVAEIDAEIAASRNYLERLLAVRFAVTGLASVPAADTVRVVTETETVVVKVETPIPESVPVVAEVVSAPVPVAVEPTPEEEDDASVFRSTANVTLPAGAGAPPKVKKVYRKREKKLASESPDAMTAAKREADAKTNDIVEDPTVDEDPKARALPPKDHPGRAEAEQKLRAVVVEFVFKRGLVSNGDLLTHCGVSPRIVNSFMTHPWFESHMGKWRLTSQGKNEGVEL